ncbi:DUF5107 domain-containing protein [Gaetbulibacter saemankumensis]|uniref:DUF5107 domain-containing protein n=1 Tax=Gaetbulibacter saemankumensis TaxID=311208 RepID=UPI0004078DEC|nr:DUF5107 domain-containing protein [Gaetbulibacter saemankumensis]
MKTTLSILFFLLIFAMLQAQDKKAQIDINQYPSGPVTYSLDTVMFRHIAYTLNNNGSINNIGKDIVLTPYKATIIENDLLKVTVVPGIGGRILSIIYKPTNHELLYQNSLATPFAGGDIFYYDWLMIWGGIFPTFPESEHGKMWYLPWKAEIITATDDEFALRMTKHDDIDSSGRIPPKQFKYGNTGITVSATVRLMRGSSAVHLDLEVQNTRKIPVEYEYWTCTTLAPGSKVGDTRSPSNTEIIAPINKVYIPNRWEWMTKLETPSGEKDIYQYDKLAEFKNWSDMGIAYASPKITANYWGVVNHDNNVGVIRVADNKNSTPGLKLWTWGVKSTTHDLQAPDIFRPYIELWAGNSTKFFKPAHLDGGKKKSWTETYLPTIGLAEFTNVNKYAAAFLKTTANVDMRTLRAQVFSVEPTNIFEVILTVNDEKTIKELLHEDWTPKLKESTIFEAKIANTDLPLGKGEWKLTLLNKKDGRILFEAAIPR